jgi:hypothetical protein
MTARKPTGLQGRETRHRSRPPFGLRQTRRIGVFAVGLLFVSVGLALVVLPGPLTLPLSCSGSGCGPASSPGPANSSSQSRHRPRTPGCTSGRIP